MSISACKICEEYLALTCPACNSHDYFDVGEDQHGEETCANCQKAFHWSSNYEIIMKPEEAMDRSCQSDSYIVDPVHGGVNEHPVLEPVRCPSCLTQTTTKKIYGKHHSSNTEICDHCGYSFRVVNHGRFNFYTSSD